MKATKVAINKERQFILLLTLNLAVYIFLQREIVLLLGIPYSLASIHIAEQKFRGVVILTTDYS